MDLLLRGGKVISGELSAQPMELNIGLRGDRIEFVGQETPTAKEVVDVSGKLVLPGFIDVHNHSDLSLFWVPSADSALRQGVTTLIVGNCGFSGAPLSSRNRGLVNAELEAHSLKLTWNTLEEYVSALPPISVNVGLLVGLGNLKDLVMDDPNRPASADELKGMKDKLLECLDLGAFGMSMGLIYPPDIHSSTDELVELAKVIASKGGIMASHQRSEGKRLFEALDESVEIARRSGVRFEISHIKAARPAWGSGEKVLEVLVRARREADIGADQYPYSASSTGLSNVFPYKELKVGFDGLLKLLRSDRERAISILKGTDHTPWNLITISECTSHPEVVGLSVAEASEIKGVEPEELVVDLLLDEGREIGAIFRIMKDEDVRLFLRQDFIAVASDSEVRDEKAEGKPHPRAFGTFAKVLEMGLKGELPLDLVVYKMSALPASRFGLKRGLIKEGYGADLVVVSPMTFKDNATYENPKRYPSGVEMVFVNGKLAFDGRKVTGNHGRVLTRG